MPNILIHPNSGIIEFNTGVSGSSSFDASSNGASRLIFSDNSLKVQSFSTGSLYSVSDVSATPVLEVFADDRVVMGQYNYNTFVVSGTVVNISGRTTIAASSTGNANFNLPHGIGPTSPVNGDIWTTDSGIYVRVSGLTIGPLGPQFFTVSGFTGTALTLAREHAGDYIRTTSATAVTITVPPTSSVNWPTDCEIIVEQAGAGQITFATGTGVVINTSEALKTQKQYSVVALKNVSGDVWTFFGERELV